MAAPPRKRIIWISAILAVVVWLGFCLGGIVRDIYRIRSDSMADTLVHGDTVQLKRYVDRLPARGDIVVFNVPQSALTPQELATGEFRIYTKRIVGLPGDTIEIRGKQLIVNGKVQTEPYAKHVDPYVIPLHPKFRRDNFQPVLLTDKAYFLMGDNRDESLDSRMFGPVPANLIKGRAVKLLFSITPRTFRIRPDRLNKPLTVD